jgi:hypothetical protein
LCLTGNTPIHTKILPTSITQALPIAVHEHYWAEAQPMLTINTEQSDINQQLLQQLNELIENEEILLNSDLPGYFCWFLNGTSVQNYCTCQ